MFSLKYSITHGIMGILGDAAIISGIIATAISVVINPLFPQFFVFFNILGMAICVTKERLL